MDWKVVTTAGAWRQLQHYLWPEISKWAGRLRWDMLGRPPFTNRELLALHLKLRHGEALAAAASNPALIEGAHADALLYVYDESKSINAGIFDASEGAFAGSGEAYALALSTPGQPAGRFYNIHARKPGYEDWHARHVTLAEAVAAGRVSAEWADQRERQWGTESALYVNRVLGEFHAGDEESVIPLAWAEAAVERWEAWQDAGAQLPPGRRVVGVDVARFGQDKTVLAVRQGNVVTELRAYTKADTMQTTGRVVGLLHGQPDALAVVDVVGIGAGVVDRLAEQGFQVVAFSAGSGTRERDRSGELGFVNVRAAAWWRMRERLDPSGRPDICLPPDDELLGDLTAPKWRELSGGKIAIESKDDMRSRIGRSTDYADAVIQSFETTSGVVSAEGSSVFPWRVDAAAWAGTSYSGELDDDEPFDLRYPLELVDCLPDDDEWSW